MTTIEIKKTNPEFIKLVKAWKKSKKERFAKYFEEIKKMQHAEAKPK